jgi:FkbM family methyltransferase
MPELVIRVAADESLIVAPDSLDAITTYVLLEQEAWFEKEISFVRTFVKPEMTVIDIGANLGLYSIAMAKLVGPKGAVFAYEPASQTRVHLALSSQLNACSNLHIVGAAVSGNVGKAHLCFGPSSELNALASGGAGEVVATTTLDQEDSSGRWECSPDFLKIDAEGEESRILRSGLRFFSRHSPLVMFEIKAGNTIDRGVQEQFESMGYQLYRLLPGAPILLRHSLTAQLDPFELNLFAAKPDRAAKLAADGLLVDALAPWEPTLSDRQEGLHLIGQYSFGSSVAAKYGDGSSVDPLFRDCLAAYAAWRSTKRPVAARCAALGFAWASLRRLCRTAPTIPRLCSLARVAWESGQRQVCAQTLLKLLKQLSAGDVNIAEPFWPTSPRFDNIDPGPNKSDWFNCAVMEQFERSLHHSSYYESRVDLKALCTNPFVSTEMERRRILRLARNNERSKVPERLCKPASDHVNFELWRSGRVPNTF